MGGTNYIFGSASDISFVFLCGVAKASNERFRTLCVWRVPLCSGDLISLFFVGGVKDIEPDAFCPTF